MLTHLSSARFKRLFGPSVIAVVAAGTLNVTPSLAARSSTLTTTALTPLQLQRWDANSGSGGAWTTDGGANPIDTKCQILGNPATDAGSWSGLVGRVTIQQGSNFLQNNPEFIPVLGPPQVDTLTNMLDDHEGLYDNMPNIEVGGTRFIAFADAAIDAAVNEGGDGKCGVHQFMQPMLGTTDPTGILAFQKYFRWNITQEGLWRPTWSRPEQTRKYFNLNVLTEQLIISQANDVAGFTLPEDFFTSSNTNSYTEALIQGLKVTIQVASLQGRQIIPAMYPSEDPPSDPTGPPGLVLTPGDSLYRTSNAISFDLGGTVATRLFNESVLMLLVQTTIGAQPGGDVNVPLSPALGGAKIGVQRVGGGPEIQFDLTHGSEPGLSTFHLPPSFGSGGYEIVTSSLPGFPTHSFIGKNRIRFNVP